MGVSNFHIVFVLERLVILLAILTQSQQESCYKTQTYFHRISKHGGKYMLCKVYFLEETNMNFVALLYILNNILYFCIM